MKDIAKIVQNGNESINKKASFIYSTMFAIKHELVSITKILSIIDDINIFHASIQEAIEKINEIYDRNYKDRIKYFFTDLYCIYKMLTLSLKSIIVRPYILLSDISTKIGEINASIHPHLSKIITKSSFNILSKGLLRYVFLKINLASADLDIIEYFHYKNNKPCSTKTIYVIQKVQQYLGLFLTASYKFLTSFCLGFLESIYFGISKSLFVQNYTVADLAKTLNVKGCIPDKIKKAFHNLQESHKYLFARINNNIYSVILSLNKQDIKTKILLIKLSDTDEDTFLNKELQQEYQLLKDKIEEICFFLNLPCIINDRFMNFDGCKSYLSSAENNKDNIESLAFVSLLYRKEESFLYILKHLMWENLRAKIKIYLDLFMITSGKNIYSYRNSTIDYNNEPVIHKTKKGIQRFKGNILLENTDETSECIVWFTYIFGHYIYHNLLQIIYSLSFSLAYNKALIINKGYNIEHIFHMQEHHNKIISDAKSICEIIKATLRIMVIERLCY